MKKLLVFQSDFGLVDGAVAAMYGVAHEVEENLKLYNLTHDITPYNIWEASYRLFQSVEYWPKGTVFISVVDPGVGSSRKSVVALTESGHYIVTPDNGTLTHLKKYVGITEIREIEESKHRRQDTESSFTFHGRDVYAYTGAKIAAGKITFEEVGALLSVENIVELEIGKIVKTEKSVKGSIDILDVRFGSLWTDITREDFLEIGFNVGDRVEVIIYNGPTRVYNNRIVYGKSFADVYVSEQLIYVNSVYRMAVAINQGNFAKAYSIGTGIHWSIEFKKVD
ncbi:S-adenosyl-l-methionine hydroxide adenosyltransferase family protein [Clostridium estertheticum]|uniref:SAM hydrolase/SAM-dependent halogenase family protein n=1 Tax=Clostridium estertheticum TaxID=238834 RepID=UPI0013E97C3C|nr:S-adenosyl-l-methionine hydroxide adenosyltransferase family protein [Clostridium estertheticum]MBZ9685857.1 S-adenosyl-l-methionine hydroxide adenosyltransferase family protein [Clostridium estertheticum]